MALHHKWKGFVLTGAVALGVTGLAATASAAPIPKDTVVTSYADDNSSDDTAPQLILLTKDNDPTPFASVPHPEDRKWLAPVGFGPDGHLYWAQATKNGTLIDATDGGDRSSAKPVATNIFATLPHKIDGLAFDAEGNAYLSLSETDDNSLSDNKYPISRVNLKTGAVSQLGSYGQARGLAIRKDADGKEILYIAEGTTGNILTYNLTDDKAGDKPFATGFPGGIADHAMGGLAFDPRGHLFVAWRMDPDDTSSGAVFDITNGGDFSDVTKTPPVLLASEFQTDINGLAFDSKNNMYIGGDNHFAFTSAFDATKGTFSDLTEYANDNGGGDCESVCVAP